MAAKNPPSGKTSSGSRLNSYRPFLDRLIFGLAVLGILTSAHLTIQQSRGFEDGCFGFAEPAQSAFNCGAVTQSEAGTLLGVANSTWGIIFYSVIALLTTAAAFNWLERRSHFKTARAGLIAFGFAYSTYLVYYQFAELDQVCALCLVSAALATLLLIAQGIDYFKTDVMTFTESDTMNVRPKRELAYMGVVAVLAILLIGADVVYFNNAEPPTPVTTIDDEQNAGRQVSDRTSIAELNEALPQECRYDRSRSPVEDYSRLVNFFDPIKGNPEAPVTVIEYFDPNCPHCRVLHSTMEEVVATHGDQARFVFKPFWLWQHSIAQSEALYAAAQEGKFFEMLEHQYAIQQPSTGLSEQQLRQIAADIGMNPDVLMQRINSGHFRSTVMQEKQRGVEIGVNSTPTVLINGRFVSTESRTTECLRRMIEQAAQG